MKTSHTFTALSFGVTRKTCWTGTSDRLDGSCFLNNALGIRCTRFFMLARISTCSLHTHQPNATLIVNHTCRKLWTTDHTGIAFISFRTTTSLVVSGYLTQCSYATIIFITKIFTLLIDARMTWRTLIVITAP